MPYGWGKGWAEKQLGWAVEFVQRPRKFAAKGVLVAWVERWSQKGVEVN
jgi:hypothetical protein